MSDARVELQVKIRAWFDRNSDIRDESRKEEMERMELLLGLLERREGELSKPPPNPGTMGYYFEENCSAKLEKASLDAVFSLLLDWAMEE